MQQIEIMDAGRVLPALLDQVEAGDEIVLTREGKPIARIVLEASKESEPSELTLEQQARAKRGIAMIRELSRELKLGPFDFEQFKRDRDEGRL